MSTYSDQLAEAVSAVTILSPTSYAWLGQPSEGLPGRIARNLSAEEARAFLRHQLERRLYADFYCHGTAVGATVNAVPNDPRGDPVLVAALTGANAGTGCWEPGWSRRGRDGATVMVERGGLTLWAPAGDCREMAGGIAGARGEQIVVDVRFPNELRRVSPGFYMALSDRALNPERGVVRLYWNLCADGAVAFVAKATRLMNELGLAARMKVANHPLLYDRCDAGVVYLQRDEVATAAGAVQTLRSSIDRHLKPSVPAFTRRLAAGVGLAVDPGGSVSFGQHLCRLVAAGLVRAEEHGLGSLHARVETVVAQVVDAGIDPEAPYLGSATAGDFSAAIDDLAAASLG